MPYMMSALGFSLAKPRQIVIAGAPGADDTRSLLRLVWQRYIPNRVLLLADGAKGQKQLARLLCATVSASLPSIAQQEKQYLDAGPGQPPFVVTRHSVPIAEIIPAGPPKDGIPALDQPKFVPAREADKFLSKHDKILGI